MTTRACAPFSNRSSRSAATTPSRWQRARGGAALSSRSAGSGHPRYGHARRDGRARRARGVQEDRPRSADHRAVGTGANHDGRAGDEARRTGFRQQAVRDHRPRSAADQRAAPTSVEPRGRLASRSAAVAVAIQHAVRPQRADGRGARPDRARRRHRRDGPHPR